MSILCLAATSKDKQISNLENACTKIFHIIIAVEEPIKQHAPPSHPKPKHRLPLSGWMKVKGTLLVLLRVRTLRIFSTNDQLARTALL